jgi:2-polyprenyl-6-methoxyphenol hydroxylase-like FAD-dependent oxidoreductase
LLHALKLCGIELEQNLGVPVQSRVTLGSNGDTIAKIDLPQTLTSWGHLYHLLKEVFPAKHYHSGKSVVSYGENSQEILVHCEDGSSYSAELMIASDGLRSSIRNLITPEVKPNYAGYVAWRGVCDEFALSTLTRETLFPYFSFGLPEGEQILGYPVAGNDNDLSIGNRRYNFVWYRKAPEETVLKDLLTDADGVFHPHGISPVQVNWRHIAAVREAARNHLAPQFAEVIEKTGLVFFQPIFDVYSEKIAYQRVALMGDAGFVARPHVGMGVSKAAEDALAIVDSIAEFGANPEALKSYEDKRLVLSQRVIQRAQYLGQYMTAQGQAELKNNLLGIADRVMKETAVDITDLLVSNSFIPDPA